MAISMSWGKEPSCADRGEHASLPNEAANASDMRAFVCTFLETADVPEDVIDEVLMAVGEVVANSCRHGRASSGPGVVDLRCERRDRVVSIRISDNGPGFD